VIPCCWADKLAKDIANVVDEDAGEVAEKFGMAWR
jgi:hypothetical protein